MGLGFQGFGLVWGAYCFALSFRVACTLEARRILHHVQTAGCFEQTLKLHFQGAQGGTLSHRTGMSRHNKAKSSTDAKRYSAQAFSQGR